MFVRRQLPDPEPELRDPMQWAGIFRERAARYRAEARYLGNVERADALQAADVLEVLAAEFLDQTMVRPSFSRGVAN